MSEIQADKNLKKKYLRRYRKNRALINRLEDKLTELDDRLYSISSPKLSDLPRGGTAITTEDLITEKSEIEDRINRLCEKGRRIKSEILDRIDELDDPRYADILELYFIDCLEFEEIADKKGYTERHVIRLYSKGIDILSV